jgi:mono/diheme cytochrome c family protein
VSACPARKQLSEAAARGQAQYLSTCIACHNTDPKQPGAVGPALVGSTRDLLEAKLVRGEYPAGYKPQRETHIMPLQPQMASSVDDLAAFLAP